MSNTRRNEPDADSWSEQFGRFRKEFGQRFDGDGDGLSFAQEAELGTSDGDEDSDGDGIDDGDEVATGSNPTVADAEADPDGDGLTNAEEAKLGTRADQDDTDGDGLTDGLEDRLGTKPTDADSDDDGLTDHFEVTRSKTNPLRADSAGDGVDDAFRDPDGDGSPHLKEQVYDTDPHDVDSDDDGHTDGGGLTGDFLERNFTEAKRTRAEADAEAAEMREGVEDSQYLIVTDPEDARHASHSALDPHVGTAFAREGSEHVLNNRTDEVEDIKTLPDGSTIAKGNRLIGAQIEGRSNLARKPNQDDVVDLRRRKQQAEDEAGEADQDGVQVPKGARPEAPPAGEREPEGWEDGDGEGELEVGDPTAMRIDKDVPEVDGGGVSLEDLPAGRSGPAAGARTSGADLTGSAPAATPDDRNPLGKAVDPDTVAESRLAGGSEATEPGARAPGPGSDPETADAGAGTGTTVFEDSRMGVETDDQRSPEGGSSDGLSDKEEEPAAGQSGQPDPTPEVRYEETEDGSSDPAKESEDGSSDPEVRGTVNQYDPATGETTTYQYDADGNVYDAQGNPVDPADVPDWVPDNMDDLSPPPDDPPPEDPPPDDPPPEDASEDGSEGVSTSVDPDGGTGDRARGEAVEAELGAPDGRRPRPIDPQEGEAAVEGRSLRHLITSDDLAQPVPDGVTPVGGAGPTVDPNASSGRGGTGSIDWGPDHVTHETGRYLDKTVPEAIRSADGDGDGGTAADATPDLGRVSLPDGVTADVAEPPPLRAVATDGREQGLQPQEGEDDTGDHDTADVAETATTTANPDGGDSVTWADPADDVPPIPEVVDDGFTDEPERFDPEPDPEPDLFEPGAEPDRFDAPDLF